MMAVFVTMMAIAGCTAPPTPIDSAASPGPASAVSWDGNYRGTVETDPQIVVRVTNNAFSQVLRHPNAPNNPTPVYSVMIAPDGSFRVGLTTVTTGGCLTGTHVSSKIDGSVCVYSVALDRSDRGAL
jgi:hypothetical protein